MNDFTLSGPGWFDRQADPVIYARDGTVAYVNPAAAEQARLGGWPLSVGAPLPEALSGLSSGAGEVILGGERWLCRVEALEEGVLYLLSRPPEEEPLSLGRLSQIAAQLRIPLGNLIGASQLLEHPRADRPPEKTEQYRAIQRKNYMILLRMLDSLEFLGAVSAREAAFRPQVLDFGGLCAEVVRLGQDLCAQAGCTLRLDRQEGNLLVRGEERMLRRLIYQLLSNALRAAGEGGRVTLRLERRGKRWVRLQVSDSGSGFSAAQLSRAFDPARAGDPLADQDRGLGLGIALCRMVAEKHGGRMALLSGGGGTVVVELPLCTDVGGGELRASEDYGGGLNEPLLQLADVLPWQCFLEENL